MPTQRPAPRRRADVPTRTGRRAAPVRRSRRRFPALPSPAAIGALALVVAGVGAIAVSSTQAPDPLGGQQYKPLSSTAATIGNDASNGTRTADNDPNAVDVSRDFDRDLLAKQAKEQAQQREAALAGLVKKTQKRAEQLKSTQWVLPVAGYRLTARFGQTSSLWSTTHTGLDFAAPTGTTLVSVAAGTVTEAGWAGAYGNRTIITLDDGTEVWYCHQSAIGVSPGDLVEPGQAIGNVGATGNVTGPHLHLEVRPGGGDPVDPYQALVNHGVSP